MSASTEIRVPDELIADSSLAPPLGSAPATDGLEGPGVYTFWKGRIALNGLLRALGVGLGSVVVVPGYTCFAVPLAVRMAGCEPIYADIDPGTFNMSLSGIEAACGDRSRGQVRVIIIQHTYGIPADTAAIVAWARDRDIAVLEDCAHVWGSRYRDDSGAWQHLGNLGDAAFFSSHWSKPVSTGLGGWARTSDPKLAAALGRFHDDECAPPSIRETLLVAAQVGVREVFSSPWLYWLARKGYRWLSEKGIFVGSSTPEELQGVEPRASDYAKQMSGFQEKLLKRRLSETSVINHRRHLKAVYDAALQSAGLPVLSAPPDRDPVLLCYPVRVRHKQRVLEEAERSRIELGDWYRYPVDRPDGIREEVFGYRTGVCPEGERASREVVTLPMHIRVTESGARTIVKFLKEVA
jgi:perosamine synthetase